MLKDVLAFVQTIWDWENKTYPGNLNRFIVLGAIVINLLLLVDLSPEIRWKIGWEGYIALKTGLSLWIPLTTIPFALLLSIGTLYVLHKKGEIDLNEDRWQRQRF